MALEAAGVPTVALHTDTFARLARSVARVNGMPTTRQAFVPQPLVGRSADELRAYIHGPDPIDGRPFARVMLEGLTGPLDAADATGAGFDRSTPRLLEPATEDALRRRFEDERWTDFLPIVLPTEERVDAMLAGTNHDRDEVVGTLRPTQYREAWELTVENGPIRTELGMNSGIGATGPYDHASATIGRAYGLLSQNLQGGSVPGETFMGSQGNNYTYNNITFAENEERSPWEPLHVQKGFPAGDSTVSVFYGCRSTTFCLGLREAYWREHVRDMLAGIDGNSAPCLLLDPITARQFIDRGAFDTKAKLIRFVHETAEMPAGRYWDLQLVQNYVYPWATFGREPMATWLKAGEHEPIRIFPAKDINVVVVGGEANG